MGDDNTPMDATQDTQPALPASGRKGRPRKANENASRGRSPRGKTASGASTQADTPSPSPVSIAQASPAARAPTRRPATRTRRGGLRNRGREPGVLRLAERARLIAEHGGVHLLADPLAALLPAARSALFNAALDEAIHAVVDEFASTLAPAVVQLWIAEAAPWSPGHERVGSLELEPSLRLRAAARAAVRGVTESGAAALQAESNMPGDLPAPDISIGSNGAMPRWPG